MVKMVMPATKTSMNQFLSMATEDMKRTNCLTKQIYEMEIAIEELFVNIVNYAYPDKEGEVEIFYDFLDKGDAGELHLTMMDTGVPYNPMEKENPDITLSAEKRRAGGLGIFLAKKFMDHISYEYKEGKNCISITKRMNKNES